jgi:S1-C subfamily serine protease
MNFISIRVGMTMVVTIILLLVFVAEHVRFDDISATSDSMSHGSSNISSLNGVLSSIFESVSNSVVQVVSITPPLFSLDPQAQNTTEVGAGFIYDDEGHIVTANHVLAGANNASVVYKDGDRIDAIVVGRDAFTDTAVLEVVDSNNNKNNNNTASEETTNPSEPVMLGNSSALMIGDQVVTIGYPFASKIAMTAGIIGQTDYLLYFPFLGYSVPNTIETDVTVNPGNSGGPLINLQGQVVGMIYGRINPTDPTSITQFPGLTVAIPSNTINRVADGLIQNGFYIHPAVGIIGSTLTVDLAKQFNNIPDNLEGVLVDTVIRGGTADDAGIDATTANKYGERQSGDVIIALDGNNIVDIESLLSYVQDNKTIGENIVFTVYRDGQYLNLNATLQPIK